MPISRPGDSRGFTLFEFIIVLILLAGASAVILPSFSTGMKGIELRTAGRDLVTRLKKVRAESIGGHRVHRVVFEQSPHLGEPARYSLTNEYGEVMGVYRLPDEVEFVGDSSKFPVVVSFYPNGRSSGGELQLRTKSGSRIRVQIDPITGFGRAEEVKGVL
ncbi:MAG TPA: prepilin-type N-terminal cleavage/methylation domain-containing protein [Acidobacteriota bacterium]|nr:prepilin-type N-terminal cleavage/methylation domain-containing protein [Acidobacteriota bacterium]